MAKSLIKNTGIYIICGFFAQGLVLLLWLILARLLTPGQIGIYALIMFVVEFFSIISLFGLDAALRRFYYAKQTVSSVLNNSLLIFCFFVFLSLILFFSLAKIIPSIVPGLSDVLKENLFLFGAVIFVNSFFNFILAHYAALKKAFIYAKLQVFKILIFSIISLGLVYFGWGVLGIFYGLLFSSLLMIIPFIIKEREIISFRNISFPVIKNIGFYSFPLMLYGSFAITTGYFGRILLDRYTDLATLGVYSLFLMLTLQLNGFWASFNRAWTPEIFSRFLENEKKARENIKFMVFFSSFVYLSGMALFIILGELFLFKLVLKEIYLSKLHVFYILLLAPLFAGVYTAVYPLFYYKKKTKIIFYLSLVIFLINICLTFFMVKFFNQIGAAVSYFLITLIDTLIYLIVFKKIINISSEIINWTFLLSVLMILGAAGLLATSSYILFLAFVILGAFLAYRIGNLSKKKYLIFDFLKTIKITPWIFKRNC